MSNFHMEIKTVSRRSTRSITGAASYACRQKLHDSYTGKDHDNRKKDILFSKIFLPDGAPPELYDLQRLCDAVEASEVRCDARTARLFIGSLPNELPTEVLAQIVSKYVNDNFTHHGLCAIAAIHIVRNKADPAKDNPHVHLIVPTRTMGPDGFLPKKNREWNKRKYVILWRKRWAAVQNWAYEREGLNIRVSHERLDSREREPIPHLNQRDWKMEQRGEHTPAGDRKREVEARNKGCEQQRQLERKHSLEIERLL